jgi:hypothetical protein
MVILRTVLNLVRQQSFQALRLLIRRGLMRLEVNHTPKGSGLNELTHILAVYHEVIVTSSADILNRVVLFISPEVV